MGGGAVPVGQMSKKYNGKATWFVYFVVIMGGCAGLLLGYDNGIIGGVTAMHDFQLKFFQDTVFAHNYPAEYAAMHPDQQARAGESAQEKAANAASPYCKYDNQILQLIVSSLYIAAAASGLFSAHWARRFGRRPLLFISGVLFVIGAALQAGAVNVAMLVVGRVVLGLGVGIASLVGPMYNAEMAPSHLRGGMNILFQLSVTVGIFVAGLINYGCDFISPWGWRLALGLAAAPGAIVALGGIVLPDSPVSYIERGKMEKAHRILVRVRGVENVDEEFQDMIESARASQLVKQPWKNLIKSKYRPFTVIATLFMLFQQFTGINAIIFYTPILFSSFGNDASTTLERTCIIGAVNVAATLVAVFLVDRLGRKVLLIEGGIQMIITHIVVGVTLKYEFAKAENLRTQRIAVDPSLAGSEVVLPDPVSVGLLVTICVFIAGFAWSWGPIGWLYPTEIQPLETRAAGSAVNTCSNMIFTFVIAQCFVTMLCAMEWGVFLFFAGMVVIMTLFVIFLLPETKGTDIENAFRLFQKHWFWGKYTAVGQVHQSQLLPQSANTSDAKEGFEPGTPPNAAANPKAVELESK